MKMKFMTAKLHCIVFSRIHSNHYCIPCCFQIRQKEAKKIEENMMRDPLVDKKLAMKERLPDLCRILKAYPTFKSYSGPNAMTV